MKLSNEQKISLSMSVFLAHDDYNYDPRPNAISATGLLKSTRQAILTQRVEQLSISMDISQLTASTLGSAVHDGIEKAWLNGNYIKAMRKLGYADSVIKRIKVNPTKEELLSDTIPVYIEQRSERTIDGFVVTGKFDFVGDGTLEDHKTTGVFTYMNDKTEKYRLQGSIYRWLNPDIVTSDRMMINFTFTDWSKLRSMIEHSKGYPPHRIMSVPITLLPLEETEKWIRARLQELRANLKKTNEDLPLCTQEELWQDATTYKYYKNPAAKDRSTKNYDNFAEAQSRLLADGSCGVVDIVRGKAKACLYCNAALICMQAKQLVLDGLLDMEV